MNLPAAQKYETLMMRSGVIGPLEDGVNRVPVLRLREKANDAAGTGYFIMPTIMTINLGQIVLTAMDA